MPITQVDASVIADELRCKGERWEAELVNESASWRRVEVLRDESEKEEG